MALFSGLVCLSNAPDLLSRAVREILEAENQLRKFRWEETQCHCSDTNHLDHKGDSVPWDKAVLLAKKTVGRLGPSFENSVGCLSSYRGRKLRPQSTGPNLMSPLYNSQEFMMQSAQVEHLQNNAQDVTKDVA